MKRMALGIMLTLGTLGLAAAPAVAAPDSPALSGADQAFLATLAVPAAQAPELVAKRPAIVGKALCTATVNCGSSTITCSSTVSTSSCSAVDRNCAAGVPGRVICNGTTTNCPACPIDCTALHDRCVDNCGSCPIRTFQCSPYLCSCDTSHGFCT